MIVNFYKMRYSSSIKGAELLISKNINCVPQRATRITFSGQLFAVYIVRFDLDKCEYNLYLIRV